MPGMFDDLIPGGGSVPPPPPMDEAPAPAAAAPPPASNMFEDLVPRAQAGEETAAPQTEAPPANMFADLIPKEEPAGVLSTFGAEAAKSAIGGPGEILKGLGVGAGTVGTEPIEQGAMYRTGAAMQKYADSWGATEASKAAHPIAATAGSTVGGFAPALPLLGASALGAPALPVLAAGAGMFGAMGAGNAFSEALLKGADENTAAKAAGLNAIVAGGLGSIPLGTMLAPVRAFAPELTGWAAQTLEKALVGGVVFTSVGEAQEFLGRQIAQNFYDPNAGYTPDVNRLLGSMLGGGLIGTVTPRMIHNERAGTAVTDEQLKSIADNIMKEMPPPVVVVDAAAKAADVEAPKINAQTTEATGIASASKAEEGWLAYHGSAAHFDQFDGGFKGTGEGAGTFGSAEAYVGEAKGTGEDYQNRMGGYRYEGQPYDATNPEHLASFLIKQQGTREAAAQFADQEAAKGTIGSAWKISFEIYGKAAALLGSDTPIAPLERIGNLYSVRVTRPTDHFIDWDQPMFAQPKYVQDRVMKAIPEGQDANITRRELADPNLLGGDFYRNLASLLGSPEAASEALHKVGIAGNRYLDQFSRGTSDRIKLLEGFQTDDAGAIGRANELLKIITDPAAVAETQAGIQRLTDQIASREAELEKLRSGTGLTRNAAVFKADDVKITHRNGEPLTTAEARAIDDIQHGAVVEDQGDGVAIVNGREVGSIPADELRKQFGKPSANDNVIDLSAERRKRDNGYSVNDNAMQSMGVKDFPDTPMTEVTTGARETTSKLFGGTTPPEAKASATAADHYYRRLKSLIGLRELLAMNPQNKPLQDYGIHLDHMLRYAAERIVNAEDTVKLATKLNSAGKTALNKMIDKYVNMSYLTAEERAKGLVRRPNQDEIRDMIASSQMDARGAKVFDRMVKDLDSFAQDMLDVMREKTVNLGPKEMAKENARLDALEKMYKERPYFPITRFGLYTVLIRGPEGNKFYRTETPREQRKLAAQLQKSLKDGEVLTLNKLPESSTPFAGLPVQMLDMIQKQFLQGAQKPDELRAALEQLKYESSPVRGITAKFANKALTPGYSQDFLRSYANFFFHGSRYLSRMRYVNLMKNAMTELRTSSLTNENPVRRFEVADFVEKHYKGILDPTTDWSIPRAFLFHMVLGFRVASAATNLTQTLISTIPHLSAEFGDARTMKATMKAATEY